MVGGSKQRKRGEGEYYELKLCWGKKKKEL